MIKHFSCQNESTKNGNSIFSNITDPFESHHHHHQTFGFKINDPVDILGSSTSMKPKTLSRSTSPPSSSSSSQSIYCGRCDNNACHRCLDCNGIFFS